MLWLLLFASLQLVHCSCPSGFSLESIGECRNKVSYGSYYADEVTGTAISMCTGKSTWPIIIHDSAQQSYWQNQAISSSNKHVIGLICNNVTKRWEWADGTAVDFKPPTSDADLDSDCSSGCGWYISSDGSWNHKCGHTTDGWNIWCFVPVDKPSIRDCDNFENDSEDSVCYQIGAAVASWQDAQIECRNYGANLASIHNYQENSFLKRLAVSTGAVNGLFLGGTITGKSNEYGWVDGSDWDYSNFYPGFPINGLGDCLTMDTLGSSGQWMNVDCNTKQSVACIRQQNASYADACSAGPWKEGQIIYTPGYPYDASLPCDYFLTVDTGKRLEVKIQLLEANSCCDHLILTDSYIGGNVVANLTGSMSGNTYQTSSSNMMRVTWNPNGGVNVRGAMFSYRAV